MACYQVNTMTIQAFNMKSKEILISALKALKMYPREYANGKIEAYPFTFDLVNQKVKFAESYSNDLFWKRIKQEYSRQVIELAAKKKNWMLKKIKENKFKATKF